MNQKREKSMTTVIAQPKWIGTSSTFWGALIAFVTTAYQVIGPIADAIGVTVPLTQDDIINAGQIGTNLIVAVGAAIGFALTIWGRIKAGRKAQPVTFIPNADPQTVTVVKPPAVAKSSG